MNNFGIYKLFSHLTAKKEDKITSNNTFSPNLSAEKSTEKTTHSIDLNLLSTLFKSVDLEWLKSLLLSLPSLGNITTKNQKVAPPKNRSDSINSFVKSHDDFVKKVMQNNGNQVTDF